jgi:hypothetical protein
MVFDCTYHPLDTSPKPQAGASRKVPDGEARDERGSGAKSLLRKSRIS